MENERVPNKRKDMRKINLSGKEKILVVRTDRIGDVILSLPVLEATKSSYPKSHLTMMISPYTRDVLNNNPHLDDVMIDDYEDSNRGIRGFFRLIKKIRGEKFDVCVFTSSNFQVGDFTFPFRDKI